MTAGKARKSCAEASAMALDALRSGGANATLQAFIEASRG